FNLGPIDLDFHPGEIVFIAGGNGSGKSTLAKILTGLYPPMAGSVRVDGCLVDDSNLAWYREHFSAVFVDGFLFEDLTGPTSPDRDAAARAYLEGFELNTKVKIEGGRFSTTALSEGQRKRLALVSAYMEDRPIYVFDEWAATQEPRFKR